MPAGQPAWRIQRCEPLPNNSRTHCMRPPLSGALHRQILGLFLTRLELIEHQIEVLDTSVGHKPCELTRMPCCDWPKCPVTGSIRPSR